MRVLSRRNNIKTPQSQFYFSLSHDAAVNLALEETLLETILPGQSMVLLYENDPAVIIGRFQNPWRECRIGFARRHNLPIFRRCSGGGTVVHGPGNLNIAVLRGGAIEKEANLNHVIKALASLGLVLEQNKRFDLLLRPRKQDALFKVGGSAFRQIAGRSLHHSTLLVDADLELIKKLLAPSPRQIETLAVASQPAPILKLSSLVPRLNVPTVVKALARDWESVEGFLPFDVNSLEKPSNFSEKLARLRSPEWTWTKTPPFKETWEYIPELGRLVLEIVEGKIVKAEAPADFLVGCSYQEAAVLAAAGSNPDPWLIKLAYLVGE